MDHSRRETEAAIDQLSWTICWLVEQIAEERNEGLSEACQRLSLVAPKRYAAQALSIAEKAFRQRGL